MTDPRQPAPPPEPSDPPREAGAPSMTAPPSWVGSSGDLSGNPGTLSGAQTEEHSRVSANATETINNTPNAAQNRIQSTPFQLQSPPKPETRKLPLKPPPAEASQSPFSITVGRVYDGPMDLLLDLIRKQNIDIYDIPIARITAQFLEYTHHLKQTDVDAAGEFIYMASLLIHIKSKLLLPRDPPPTSTRPTAKIPAASSSNACSSTSASRPPPRCSSRNSRSKTPPGPTPACPASSAISPPLRPQPRAAPETGLALEDQIAADTGDLVRVFSDVLARLRARPVLNVNEDQVTVAQMMEFMKRRMLMEDKPISLRRLLHSTHTERAVICAFLAMLELVRLQAVLLFQPAAQGDILLKKSAAFDQIFEDDSIARDDWR